jgi:hypothetical protein
MISNKNFINYKVVLDLSENYNFYIGHFSIQGHLRNSKFWNKKIWDLIYIFGTLNDLKLWNPKWSQTKNLSTTKF